MRVSVNGRSGWAMQPVATHRPKTVSHGQIDTGNSYEFSRREAQHVVHFEQVWQGDIGYDFTHRINQAIAVSGTP